MTALGSNGHDRMGRNGMRGRTGPEGKRGYGNGAGLDGTERDHTGLDGADWTGQDRTAHGTRIRVGVKSANIMGNP